MIAYVKYGKKFLVLTILSFNWFLCFSQEYEWWNQKHNWDGVTPWHNYMIVSPGFMGPNALPVPVVKNGELPENSNFKIGLEQHMSHGDLTANLFTELYLNLFSHRVGLNIQFVPVEYYKMDTLTRDIRRARGYVGEGFAIGDVYLGTYIQLVEDKKHVPDILLTINLKTASGTKLSDARYTDTPGYFFDVSVGKKISLNGHPSKSIRPHAMMGFYVWQLNGNGQLQNDAFLYGAGFDLMFPKFELINSVGGYVGYLGNGDQPMVYRLRLKSKFDSTFNYEMRFQRGIYDFGYTSLSFFCNINLSKIGMEKMEQTVNK